MISIPPQAESLLESLRGLGYSCATALSDIIDNSIAANARNVWIDFIWNGKFSRVEILDDGTGMTKEELVGAMKFGKNPNIERSENDLGRFGLGLKTASFSQCRSLSVLSKKSNMINILKWDLDYISSLGGNEWIALEEVSEDGNYAKIKLDQCENGTMILWEKLDHIIPSNPSVQEFLDAVTQVEQHLSMTFHRYLEENKLKIFLNGNAIHPWDPFLTNHPATQQLEVERIRAPEGKVSVQCFILPHKDLLETNSYLNAGGPDGWTAQQGFYVYRGERLLVAGSWLGLGKNGVWSKEEAHRLARIRIDITNKMDFEWKIDIRKSKARPPGWLKVRLSSIAEFARARARDVYAHRSPRLSYQSKDETSPIWSVNQNNSSSYYSISQEHPLLSDFISDLSTIQAEKFKSIIRIIEKTVPVRQIWLDASDGIEQTPHECDNRNEILEIVKPLYIKLITKQKMSSEDAKKYLLKLEPFDQYPNVINELKITE